MTRILTCALVLASFTLSAQAWAAEPSYIAVSKSKDGDNRFVFQMCAANVCEPIDSKIGYTSEQILSLWGTAKQFGAGGMAVFEAIILGGTLFVPFGSSLELLLFTGRGAIAASGGAAIYYFNTINPYEVYKSGQLENQIASAISSGDAAVVLYSSPDLQETLKVKARLESILSKFD